MSQRTIKIATRGSALALVQSNFIMGECKALFPQYAFELQIIKTTGDKLQTINLTNPNQQLTKGLFTKELEMAMLNGEADLAVHSLKDLPTELPEGLKLGAVSRREDVRDVLIYAGTETGHPNALQKGSGIKGLPENCTIATSSTRRQAQLLAIRPDIKTTPIRGNVGTRLQKLLDRHELSGIILALAGLKRLGFEVSDNSELKGKDVPPGLCVKILSTEEMLPCVGQAALGIEIRQNDPALDEICAKLTHQETYDAVMAERAFLRGMGGGCLSPIAALGTVANGKVSLKAVSFRNEQLKRAEGTDLTKNAEALGLQLAQELLA
ncbi:MAG: hydroxymethylbilane synthase [Verrucomicrobiales bacterium]